MKKKDKILKILIPANQLIKGEIDDIKEEARDKGYTKIEFIAEPLIGAYLTIDVLE